jgi:threonine/homoserine/homoserine lactone efflux protein
VPAHPHLLLTSLIGTIIVWTSLRGRRASWLGRDFGREERPMAYWLSTIFGVLLIAAGVYFAFR